MYSSFITFVAILVASAYATSITSASNFPSQTGFPVHSHVTRTASALITGHAASVHSVAIKPTTGPAPEFSGYVTVNITNKHTASLSVAVTSDPSAPSASGDPQPSLLGDSTQFLFEKGFSGLIGVAPQLDSADSKIELSYDKSVYADVSYVDGYTVPITCSCDKETVYMGCNIQLWNTTQSCPDEGDGPICYNPAAANVDGPAHPFFEPCQGAAYTFPTDDSATRACKSSMISCCVGADCPANPNQLDQGLSEHGG
ncbi:hypothetical protein JMJ35_005544 [Cladonia borealis]|uniref:Uncharacterized protein n=1 Tax=Cladonia borealis TaxID=184061 RepID=A0AA39R1N7_9LECA|nr:hypothetical protein JMJ35_005544 [Cladonia borealis]